MLEPHLAAPMAVLGVLTGHVIAVVSVRRRFNLAALLVACLYIGIFETMFRKMVLSFLTLSGIFLLASSVPHVLLRMA